MTEKEAVPAVPMTFWQWLLRPGVTAVAEAMFPSNDLGAPDWRAAELVPRILSYFKSLPPFERRLMTVLYMMVQFATILSGRHLLPFSWLSREKRTAIIREWRASRLLPWKILGDGLKTTMTMIYLSHPSALRYMGVYTGCENPADTFDLDLRPNALPQGSGHALVELK